MARLMIRLAAIATAMVLPTQVGCTLVEVRSKSKAGPEWRHKGSGRTSDVRWSVEQGVQFAWQDAGKNKLTTGITYRRRDVDEGGGDNDNGVWFDVSFPLWHAPSPPDRTASRIEVLERRLAALEARLAASAPPAPTTTGDPPVPTQIDKEARRCAGDPGIY